VHGRKLRCRFGMTPRDKFERHIEKTSSGVMLPRPWKDQRKEEADYKKHPDFREVQPVLMD
jgi:hypothetical protein